MKLINGLVDWYKKSSATIRMVQIQFFETPRIYGFWNFQIIILFSYSSVIINWIFGILDCWLNKTSNYEAVDLGFLDIERGIFFTVFWHLFRLNMKQQYDKMLMIIKHNEKGETFHHFKFLFYALTCQVLFPYSAALRGCSRQLKSTHKHFYCRGEPNVASLRDILARQITLMYKQRRSCYGISTIMSPCSFCYWKLLSDWITLTSLSLNQNTARKTTWGKQGHLTEGCWRLRRLCLFAALAIMKHFMYQTPTEGGREQGSRGWEKEGWEKTRVCAIFLVSYRFPQPELQLHRKSFFCLGKIKGDNEERSLCCHLTPTVLQRL